MNFFVLFLLDMAGTVAGLGLIVCLILWLLRSDR